MTEILKIETKLNSNNCIFNKPSFCPIYSIIVESFCSRICSSHFKSSPRQENLYLHLYQQDIQWFYFCPIVVPVLGLPGIDLLQIEQRQFRIFVAYHNNREQTIRFYFNGPDNL